jgi:outer membrane protein
MIRTSVAPACAVVAAFASTISMAWASPTPTPTPPMTRATAMPAAASPQPQAMAPSPSPTELSLKAAEDIALASSPQLSIARAQVDQASAGVGIARSGELPNLNGQATYARSESNVRGVTSGTTTTGPVPGGSAPVVFTQNDAFIQLSQLVLDGGRVNAEVQAARFTTDSAKLSLLREVQTLLLNTAQQYYAALQARHQLQAAEKSLDVARIQEKLVEAQFHAGVASKADVLTAQLPVSQAEVTVAAAQNGEAQNVATLLTTMGIPANTPVTLKDDTTVSLEQPNLASIMDAAFAQRTDLAASKATLQQTQASVRAAQLAAFPVIGATAASGTASTTSGGSNYAANWSIGANLTFPIYQGGLIRAQTNQARGFEQQAQANYRSSQLDVYQTVEQAYLQLNTAQSSYKTAQVALDQARVLLDVTNAQYKAGVTTLILLLNAQSQLTTAQSNYVQAVYGYKIAQQNLLYAEGTIAPM